MHFAQTLDADVVPEWKSQYVNYDQGKKLISKLEKSMGSQLTSWQLPPPAQDLPSSHEQSSQSLSSQPRPSVVNSEGGIMSNVEPPTPSAQRQDSTRFRSANARPMSRPDRKLLNERSPLLDTPGTRLYTTPREGQGYSESSSGSIGMQPMETSMDGKSIARKSFFNWLNSEVSRSNSFYEAMEKECRTKLKLLEVQFDHFQEHKAIHHKERASGVPKTATSFVESLDLPTLPAVFRGLGSQKHDVHPVSRQAAHTSDFNNKDDRVSYYQAKTMLRLALSDFYQSLLQLRGFRQLNQTAVRKIVKKFDKQLNFSTLDKYLEETKKLCIRSSDELDKMINECEYIYAFQFTKDNHKLAVDSLNIRTLKTQDSYDFPVLSVGLFIGAAIPLIILALYSALHFVKQERPWEVRYMLQMYGGFVLLAVIMIGVGAAMAVWSSFRINYPFIIELDRSSMMNFREFALLPAVYIFFLALCCWLTFNTTQTMRLYYPCLFLGLFCIGLGIPYGPYWRGRRWLLHSLWRLVFSGLYAVEFRDLLLGDITCSLSYTFSTMEQFFCVYSTSGWWEGSGAQHAQRCTSRHSRALGFLECLPGIWRFMQCWRRYADTLDWFPHLLNAGKYSFTILYYMSLSIARISPDDNGLKAMFIVFALINSLYTAIWDIFMDFSLTPSSQLRSVLVYPKWTYWCIMILDPVMRQNWILYAVFWKYKQEGAFISFIVALIEASRRVLWVMFRVENEHAANIARCRAFKDLNLPYDHITEESKSYQHDVEQQPPTRVQTQPNLSSQGQSPSFSTNSRRFTRTSTFPASADTSAAASPSLRRMSAAFTSPLSPRIQFAHTNDFGRRKPKASEEHEDALEEDED